MVEMRSLFFMPRDENLTVRVRNVFLWELRELSNIVTIGSGTDYLQHEIISFEQLRR